MILALETSCDETAAAVVSDEGTVHASVVSSQADLHGRYGGVVPEIASRRHLELVSPVVREALGRADVSVSELDRVAVTQGPGLVGALLVGISAAKALAWSARLPLVPVDHLDGHVASLYLGEEPLEERSPDTTPAELRRNRDVHHVPGVDVAGHDQVPGQLTRLPIRPEREGARLLELGDEHRARPRSRVGGAFDLVDRVEVVPLDAPELDVHAGAFASGARTYTGRSRSGSASSDVSPAWSRACGTWTGSSASATSAPRRSSVSR